MSQTGHEQNRKLWNKIDDIHYRHPTTGSRNFWKDGALLNHSNWKRLRMSRENDYCIFFANLGWTVLPGQAGSRMSEVQTDSPRFYYLSCAV